MSMPKSKSTGRADRPAWIEVDLGAIADNLGKIRKILKSAGRHDPPEIMAVVKANGYGHGALPVAQAALAAGATWLGVALPQELQDLREAGIDAPCLVMMEPGLGGDNRAGNIDACIGGDGAFAVCSRAVADAAAARAKALGRPARVHVKIDTGMHRMGLLPEDAVPFLRYLRSLDGLAVDGIFTHFACADEPDPSFTRRQIKRFNSVLAASEAEGLCPPIRHAANSAGTILYPDAHYDLVRIGIAMYGLQPGEATRAAIRLTPALSLKARVARVHLLKPGESVSYGATYTAKTPVVIATVPLGYADGYRRGLSNTGHVICNRLRCPIRGRVCMDQFMFEASPDAGISYGDVVTLIGAEGEESVSTDDLASILCTINYEVVTGLSTRLPRIYTGHSGPSASIGPSR